MSTGQITLIGQYDSPFVRRVAIALHYYGVPFQRDRRSVFADQASLAEVNPIGRVPTLILDDGLELVDSAAILDAVDELFGGERRLMPVSGAARRQQMQLTSVAIGGCEKAVACLYERHKRRTDPAWLSRLEQQTDNCLGWLEQRLAQMPAPSHAQIATAVLVHFIQHYLPEMHQHLRPALLRKSEQAEQTAWFQAAPFEPD